MRRRTAWCPGVRGGRDCVAAVVGRNRLGVVFSGAGCVARVALFDDDRCNVALEPAFLRSRSCRIYWLLSREWFAATKNYFIVKVM